MPSASQMYSSLNDPLLPALASDGGGGVSSVAFYGKDNQSASPYALELPSLFLLKSGDHRSALPPLFDLIMNETRYLNGTNRTLTSQPSVPVQTAEVSLFYVIFVSVILSLIDVGTLVGNLLVVIAVLTTKSLHTVTNSFIMSLAVADMLVAVLVMPFSIYMVIYNNWKFGSIICDLWVSCDVMLCTASILNLCCISLDRYFAITRPLTYSRQRSPRLARAMIAIVWIASVLISCPPVFGWKDKNRNDDAQTNTCSLNLLLSYRIYSSMGSFFLPCIVMVFVYLRIFKVIHDREKYLMSSTTTNSTTFSMTNGKGGFGDYRNGNSKQNSFYCNGSLGSKSVDFSTASFRTNGGSGGGSKFRNTKDKLLSYFSRSKEASNRVHRIEAFANGVHKPLGNAQAIGFCDCFKPSFWLSRNENASATYEKSSASVSGGGSQQSANNYSGNFNIPSNANQSNKPSNSNDEDASYFDDIIIIDCSDRLTDFGDESKTKIHYATREGSEAGGDSAKGNPTIIKLNKVIPFETSENLRGDVNEPAIEKVKIEIDHEDLSVNEEEKKVFLESQGRRSPTKRRPFDANRANSNNTNHSLLSPDSINRNSASQEEKTRQAQQKSMQTTSFIREAKYTKRASSNEYEERHSRDRRHSPNNKRNPIKNITIKTTGPLNNRSKFIGKFRIDFGRFSRRSSSVPAHLSQAPTTHSSSGYSFNGSARRSPSSSNGPAHLTKSARPNSFVAYKLATNTSSSNLDQSKSAPGTRNSSVVGKNSKHHVNRSKSNYDVIDKRVGGGGGSDRDRKSTKSKPMNSANLRNMHNNSTYSKISNKSCKLTVNGGGSKNQEQMRLIKESKAAKTLAIVVGGFVVSWLPFFIMYVLEAVLPKDTISKTLADALTWLGYFNSVVNPVIYAFYSKQFRSAFIRLTIGKCHSKCTNNNHGGMYYNRNYYLSNYFQYNCSYQNNLNNSKRPSIVNQKNSYASNNSNPYATNKTGNQEFTKRLIGDSAPANTLTRFV